MKGIDKLYSGDFNFMQQEWQSDNSVIITLFKDSDNKVYRFRVRDLYKENETVTEHQVIPTNPPQWLLERMGKARGHGKSP